MEAGDDDAFWVKLGISERCLWCTSGDGKGIYRAVDSDKALVTVASVRAAMYWCGGDGR
jgi:hypothetical protein